MDIFRVRDQLIGNCMQLIGTFVDLHDNNTFKHSMTSYPRAPWPTASSGNCRGF
jgi:hypothetical protein